MYFPVLFSKHGISKPDADRLRLRSHEDGKYDRLLSSVSDPYVCYVDLLTGKLSLCIQLCVSFDKDCMYIYFQDAYILEL